jgi:peptide subunit release factor 1 (eRF1)
MSDPQANEAEKNIEIWKVKKLIKRLEAARGNGTSMISLIIRTAPSPEHDDGDANGLQLP